MFKNILGRRKRTALLADATDEVLSMLERARRMFEVGCSPELKNEETAAQVDRDDRDINAGERLVRRMVFEHLTINPDQDLPTSLALISIVHDVERLGDYAKSLVELNRWGELWSGEERYAQLCCEIHQTIAPLYGQVQEALRQSDAELARQVMRQHEEIKGRTDAFVEAVMQDASSGQKTVLYTLASRFLRRISAHLSNVASSVANPLDRVGGKEVRE
jgi:Na+/phosphate symporter